MKKILFAALLMLSVGMIVTGCGASRKTGCPNNQNIVH
jgi:hypothetical protein